MEMQSMYGLFKCITLVLFAADQLEKSNGMRNGIIPLLGFACVIALQSLFFYFPKTRRWVAVMDIGTAAICLVFAPSGLLLFVLVMAAEAVDAYSDDTTFYWITICIGGLAAIITEADGMMLILVAILYASLYFIRHYVRRLVKCHQAMEEQRLMIKKLEERLKDNRQYMKTLQDTAALEERNRLATRLHDKVGHGISGSIIMLEASMLLLDLDKEKAREGINRAVLNLREGVDDIRAALREERPVTQKLGMNEIQKMLEEFQINHDKKTRLAVNGDMERIEPEVLVCIYDNAKECLTNLLKHSDATLFELKITRKNKVTAVEYKDNGSKRIDANTLVRGLGLQAMEERTIKAGGRFFIADQEFGFKITNIFIEH